MKRIDEKLERLEQAGRAASTNKLLRELERRGRIRMAESRFWREATDFLGGTAEKLREGTLVWRPFTLTEGRVSYTPFRIRGDASRAPSSIFMDRTADRGDLMVKIAPRFGSGHHLHGVIDVRVRGIVGFVREPLPDEWTHMLVTRVHTSDEGNIHVSLRPLVLEVPQTVIVANWCVDLAGDIETVWSAMNAHYSGMTKLQAAYDNYHLVLEQDGPINANP